jgi:hypothetical protein
MRLWEGSDLQGCVRWPWNDGVCLHPPWIPACAGMTRKKALGPGFRQNDDRGTLDAFMSNYRGLPTEKQH